MKSVIILGSTGSIGTQALEIVQQNPGKFKVVGLSANRNQELLSEQARRFNLPSSKAVIGAEASCSLIEDTDADLVLNGITGSIGLQPTISTLKTGKTLALANKESLIVGGHLVTQLAAPGQIVPVDSEHSALAQCLLAGNRGEVRKLILTASGGPFRGYSYKQLESVTPEQALHHPTWNMGKVVTTNSATMVNKGLEIIEAHLLFGVGFDRIEVTVHPQSVVHSMVEFFDGSTMAQCSPPDMKLPISLGLAWPDRVADAATPVDFTSAHSWDFYPLDENVFKAVALAREAGQKGLTYPAVYNAANEQAVDAFHDGKISFTRIVELIEETLNLHQVDDELTLERVLEAERWARETANSLIAEA
ncbi:MAG: 1-deoxy-D-xylulose-5-phosphate reductoisomerase [Rhodoluna sp.]